MSDPQSQRIRERRKHRRRQAQAEAFDRALRRSSNHCAPLTTAPHLGVAQALQLIKDPNRRLAIAGAFTILGLLGYLLQFL